MPYIDAKCPNCGGALMLDDSMDRGFCNHCGSPVKYEQAFKLVKVDEIVNVNRDITLKNLIVLLYRDIDNGKYHSVEYNERYKRALELDPDNEELLSFDRHLVRNGIIYNWFIETDVVEIPEGTQKIWPGALKNKDVIREISFPSSLKKIPAGLLENLNKIEKIYISEGVEEIENYAFRGTKIKEIKLPSTIKSIKKAFSGSEIEKIELPEGIEDLTSSFSNCFFLQEIKLPQTIKYIDFAFANCRSLKKINIPGNVKELRDTFKNCKNLKEALLSEGLNVISRNAFANCVSLEKITIPRTVSTIGPYAFIGCGNLREVVFNRTKPYISKEAFDMCKNINMITIDKEKST